MKVAGIVAEYNPLHNGHAYHIAQSRRQTGCDYVVAVMSGNFVQRGEPAVIDKYQRAEWALRAGADMVLELPTVFALGNAERFAYGGVRTLLGTGVVTHLCFGSEVSSEALHAALTYDANADPLFAQTLKSHLAMGKSYPRAYYETLVQTNAPQDVQRVFETPNSLLALEYMRVLERFGKGVVPTAILRMGNDYRSERLTGTLSSATAIRAALQQEKATIKNSVPPYVFQTLCDGYAPVTASDFDALLLYALRRMTLEQIKNLPDVQEGMEHLIQKAAQKANTLAEFLEQVKSKRYTMARCKRIAFSALLGIDRALVQSAMENEQSLYLRVLGFKENARELLSLIGKQATLPLVLRHADIKNCSPPAQALIEKDCFAGSTYALMRPVPRDFTQKPVMI